MFAFFVRPSADSFLPGNYFLAMAAFFPAGQRTTLSA
jgi:hypothetical protein